MKDETQNGTAYQECANKSGLAEFGTGECGKADQGCDNNIGGTECGRDEPMFDPAYNVGGKKIGIAECGKVEPECGTCQTRNNKKAGQTECGKMEPKCGTCQTSNDKEMGQTECGKDEEPKCSTDEKECGTANPECTILGTECGKHGCGTARNETYILTDRQTTNTRYIQSDKFILNRLSAKNEQFREEKKLFRKNQLDRV